MVVNGNDMYIGALVSREKDSKTNRNPLELLYTEGAEITTEDWGNMNARIVNSSVASIPICFIGTLCKSVVFPDTQSVPVGLHNNKNLEFYDSGNGMKASGVNNDTHIIAAHFFNSCSNLKTLWMGEDFLPFANYAFYYCNNLTEVHYRGTIDKWAAAGRNGNVARANPFGYSAGGSFYLGDSTEPIAEIHLTTATTIAQGAFYNFKDITRVRLGASVATIGTSAFAKCASLDTVILEGDTVKTLSNANAFTDTPIADSTGTIYIRTETADEAALVAEYRAATNWSTFAAIIKPYSECVGGAE